MIGAAKRWIKRNRKGLAIGVGVVSAGYLVAQYALSKLSEARERLNSDRIAKENLRRRFEQNQADCTFTVLALLPTAAENILDTLPVEELTQELQKKRAERLARMGGDMTGSEISSTTPSLVDDGGRSVDSFIHASQLAEPTTEGEIPQSKKSKAQLWNEVKISAVTRSYTLIYTLSLLILLTRIQLNLLGRRNYLSSVMSMASAPADASTISLEDHDDDPGHAFGNDFETNRRYLTFSWWLLHRGWKDLMEKVKSAVEDVFAPLNPREDISLEKLSDLTLEVRKKVEGATEEERRQQKWLPYLLPPKEEEDYVLQESGVVSTTTPSSPHTVTTLRHLLDETSDLIESPFFTRILTSLNNEGFATLIDQKCGEFAFRSGATSQPPKASPQDFSSSATIVPVPSGPKAKLATVLAVMTREAHSIGNGTTPPNEYLVAMENGVRELEAFAAVVYSSNFDFEMPHSGLDNGLGGSTSLFPSDLVRDNNGAGDLDIAHVDDSLVDLGSSSQVREAAEVAEEKVQGPTEALASGAPTDPGFEKVWGQALEKSAAEKHDLSNDS